MNLFVCFIIPCDNLMALLFIQIENLVNIDLATLAQEV